MDSAGDRAVAVLADGDNSRIVPLMTGGGHDISDVQIRQVENGFLVRCACGWESDRQGLAVHAAEEWQHHRKGVQSAGLSRR